MTLISIEELLRIFYHVFNFLLGGSSQTKLTSIRGAAKVEYRMHVMDNVYVMEI